MHLGYRSINILPKAGWRFFLFHTSAPPAHHLLCRVQDARRHIKVPVSGDGAPAHYAGQRMSLGKGMVVHPWQAGMLSGCREPFPPLVPEARNHPGTVSAGSNPALLPPAPAPIPGIGGGGYDGSPKKDPLFPYPVLFSGESWKSNAIGTGACMHSVCQLCIVNMMAKDKSFILCRTKNSQLFCGASSSLYSPNTGEKMTRTIYILCALVIAAAILCCGCTNTTTLSEDQAPSAGTRTVTDMEGNQITLPADGATFAVFGGPISQVPYLLGANASVTAVTKGAQMMQMMQEMDPDIADKPAPRTTNGNVNIEELLIANPDCVIAFDVDGNIVASQTDIPVIYLSGTMGDGFAEIRQEVIFMGEVFQKPERAQAYVEYLNETLAFLRSRTADIPEDERVSVFLGEGVSHLQTLGGDTFFTEWTEVAGCTNAVYAIETTQGQQEGMHTGINEISMEQILAVDPGMIIIDTGNPAELATDERWKDLRAVKESRVYKEPTALFLWSRPSAESAVLYPLWLAYTAYPDRFSDMSLTDRIKDFYAEIFEYSITDAQAQKIINGTYGRVTFGQVQQSG